MQRNGQSHHYKNQYSYKKPADHGCLTSHDANWGLSIFRPHCEWSICRQYGSFWPADSYDLNHFSLSGFAHWKSITKLYCPSAHLVDVQDGSTSSIAHIRYFIIFKRKTQSLSSDEKTLWFPLAWCSPSEALVSFAMKRHHLALLAFAHLSLAPLWSLPWFITQPRLCCEPWLGIRSVWWPEQMRVCLCSCVRWCEGGGRGVGGAWGGPVDMCVIHTVHVWVLLFAVQCSFCHSMFPEPKQHGGRADWVDPCEDER